jgi:hypothetical protein
MSQVETTEILGLDGFADHLGSPLHKDRSLKYYNTLETTRSLFT